jgi:hypothetical protein
MASDNRAPQIAALERNNIIAPSIDFLERSVPDAARDGRANADALTDSRQCFAEYVPIAGDGTVVGTSLVLSQCSSFSPSKKENASAK